MGTGEVGHIGEPIGQGQGVEHADGLDDVFVDLETLFVRQRTFGHCQVVDLAPVERILRQFHIKSPAVTGIVLLHGRHLISPFTYV